MILGIGIGFLCALILLFLLACAYGLGANFMARDAEKRLRGQLPVDDFWRKRGMKDPC